MVRAAAGGARVGMQAVLHYVAPAARKLRRPTDSPAHGPFRRAELRFHRRRRARAACRPSATGRRLDQLVDLAANGPLRPSRRAAQVWKPRCAAQRTGRFGSIIPESTTEADPPTANFPRRPLARRSPRFDGKVLSGRSLRAGSSAAMSTSEGSPSRGRNVPRLTLVSSSGQALQVSWTARPTS